MANSLLVQIEPHARQALATSTVAELRDLTVEKTEDQLQISGEVSSFYYKQLAQELVMAVSGDVEVVNEVSVSDVS